MLGGMYQLFQVVQIGSDFQTELKFVMDLHLQTEQQVKGQLILCHLLINPFVQSHLILLLLYMHHTITQLQQIPLLLVPPQMYIGVHFILQSVNGNKE